MREKLINVTKSYEEELHRRKSAVAALAQLTGQLPAAQLKKAEDRLAKGDTAAAEEAFDAVVDKGAKAVALAAYQSGQLAEGRLDYAKAIRQYTKAVVLEEDNPGKWLCLWLTMSGRRNGWKRC